MGHQAELEQAMNEYSAIVRQVKHHQATDDQFRGMMAANAHMNAVSRTIAREIRAQAPSSKHGTRAKQHALREIALWILANNYEDKAFQAAIDRKSGRVYDRWYTRSDQAMKRHYREGRIVHREFKAAGFTVPRNGVGA